MQSKNCLVKVVTMYSIRNPMSVTGANYRNIEVKHKNVLYDCKSVTRESQKYLHDNSDITSVLFEMIAVRDGNAQCENLTVDDVHYIIDRICLS